jgi:hypothetical protein
MKRENKLRVWNVDDNKMEQPLVFAICNDGILKPLINCSDGNRAYKDYPIMQSTFKNDEYGKEIYVGDIISDRPNGKYLCEVIYDIDLMAYATKNLKTGAIAYLSEFTYAYVVGNIYANSNLLSVKQHEA